MASIFENIFVPSIFITDIGGVALDVSLRQTHTFPSRITENPVEDGTTFSDHQVLLPVVLEIDGRITDSPIGSPLATGRAADAFRELVRLQRSKTPFVVSTGLARYENMLIKELSVPRSAEDGRSVRFTATIEEILVVGGQAPVNRDIISEDVRHTALPIKNGGFVTKVPA